MPRLEDLERLLAVDPTDAFVLYGIAQEHAKAGNTRRAVEFYDRCLASDPGYLYAYYHKARALEAGGDPGKALETAREGLAAANRAGDSHAQSELTALVDELE